MQVIKPKKNNNNKQTTTTVKTSNRTDAREIRNIEIKKILNAHNINTEQKPLDLENIENVMDSLLVKEKKYEEEKGSITFDVTLTKKQFKKWVKLGGIKWLRAMLVNKSAKTLMQLKKEIGQSQSSEDEIEEEVS